MFLVDFLVNTFVRRTAKPEDAITIDEVTPTDLGNSGKSNKPKHPRQFEERTASALVLQINRLLGVICLLSFVAILAYPIITPTKLPEIIPNTFSMTLGYFGSALLTFLEGQSKN